MDLSILPQLFAITEAVKDWTTELVTIILIVLVFNFFAKWILKKLHYRFEAQKRYWHDSFVRALYLPLSYYAWFFALIHALQFLNVQIFHLAIFTNMQLWLKIGAIIAIAWFGIRWKRNLVQILTNKSKTNEVIINTNKIDVINKLSTVLIFFITILLFLEVTGSNITTLIAFGGVGGLALAFASQEIISNFFGGLMIYTTHPFQIGDWINLPEKNIEGHVEEIGWYMTRIRTFEKRPIYIPNSLFSKSVVMTPSRMTHRRFKETVGLRYSDLHVVTKVIADIKTMLSQHPGIEQNQRIAVFLNAYGAYSLDIQISAYTDTTTAEGYSEIRQDLLLKIYEIILKHGAEMAVPVTYVEMVKNL